MYQFRKIHHSPTDARMSVGTITMPPTAEPGRQGALRSRRLIEVTRDVACLPLSLVNVYFVGEPGAAAPVGTLIDAGLAWSRSPIEQAAAQRFGLSSRPSAIVLTHGHFDH